MHDDYYPYSIPLMFNIIMENFHFPHKSELFYKCGSTINEIIIIDKSSTIHLDLKKKLKNHILN